MDLDELLPRSDEDKFLQLAYGERLEKLKPTITQLYMGNYGPNGKRMTMRQVTEFMKDKFAFHMSQNQLEHTLRKWNVRRRILTSEKDDLAVVLGKRSRTVASTSDVLLQEGKPVDKKQLKRHLQDKIRRHVIEVMAPGVLSSWNLPYNALIRSIVPRPDMPSPFGDQSTTPGYITVNSPQNAAGASPADTISPSMQLVRQRLIQDQSNLLLQGRVKELFINCGREDRIALTNYMHDFWIHTFVTAKYWGRGPLLWTKEMINSMTLNSLASPRPTSASSPNFIASPPLLSRDEIIISPTRHCRWVIHVAYQSYSHIKEDPIIVQSSNPLETPWPPVEHSHRSFPQSIRETITESTFTSLSPDELPISSPLIAESLRKDPNPLRIESLRFAIMAGNVELVESIIIEEEEEEEKEGEEEEDPMFDGALKEINPYHLAASHLDGGNTCCSMLSILLHKLGEYHPMAKGYIDTMGHTVLDSLVVSILRSHTNVPPRNASPSFVDTSMYPGEEKDMCGRWDADSPSIRQLFQRGKYRVPLEWKHPFCHSSVQAVCHSLIMLFPPDHYLPYISRSSGLFVRYCSTCGAKLSLGTLHLVVILAYHLANSGISGETLFGTVAILVCLLRLGANVSLKEEISIHEILGVASTDRCHHAYLDADEFMQTIPLAAVNGWSPECRIGWNCIRGILRLSKTGKIQRRDIEANQHVGFWGQFDSMDIDGYDDGGDKDCPLEMHHRGRWRHSSFPCGNPQLGLIWAVIQAEMITHRKIDDATPWISDHFSMTALNSWLDGRSEELDMPFVQNHMLKEHSPCGWFDYDSFPLHTADDVTVQHIMNMDMNNDLYHRASFLPQERIYC